MRAAQVVAPAPSAAAAAPTGAMGGTVVITAPAGPSRAPAVAASAAAATAQGAPAQLPQATSASLPQTAAASPPATAAQPQTAAASPPAMAAQPQTASASPQKAAPAPPQTSDNHLPAAPAPSPGPGPAANTVVCPQCGHNNSPSNLFCGSCGFRLGAAAARAPAAPVETPGSAVVLTALRADGSEAGTYQLSGGGVIGRETGAIFAGDSYLSPRHAAFRLGGPGRAFVKDEGSLNGVYKKLGRDLPIELRPNDIFRIGQEIIKFEPLAPQGPTPDGVERLGAPSKGYVGRIALVIGRDDTGNAFPIPESGVHLGRERGDILFPEDGYVSGLHCRLSWDGAHLFLTDLGSSNGTFVRITSEAEVRTGDVLLMGQQLFRVAV
jgi:pSer/pThr/pTyr-binding forkhead associated (FHA) protein